MSLSNENVKEKIKGAFRYVWEKIKKYSIVIVLIIGGFIVFVFTGKNILRNREPVKRVREYNKESRKSVRDAGNRIDGSIERIETSQRINSDIKQELGDASGIIETIRNEQCLD